MERAIEVKIMVQKSMETKFKQKADAEIEREKKNAINSLKNEVSGIAVSNASKVIEKDINEKDHEALIRSISACALASLASL